MWKPRRLPGFSHKLKRSLYGKRRRTFTCRWKRRTAGAIICPGNWWALPAWWSCRSSWTKASCWRFPSSASVPAHILLCHMHASFSTPFVGFHCPLYAEKPVCQVKMHNGRITPLFKLYNGALSAPQERFIDSAAGNKGNCLNHTNRAIGFKA